MRARLWGPMGPDFMRPCRTNRSAGGTILAPVAKDGALACAPCVFLKQGVLPPAFRAPLFGELRSRLGAVLVFGGLGGGVFTRVHAFLVCLCESGHDLYGKTRGSGFGRCNSIALWACSLALA